MSTSFGRQSFAIAALIAHDDFAYVGVGSDLHGNGGGFGFADSWSGNTSYNIASGSLNSPRDPLPLVGNSVSGVAYGDNRGIDRTLSVPLGVEGTSAYVSFVMQPQGILNQGAYNGWFGLALRGSTDIVVGMGSFSGNKYGLEVGFEQALTSTIAVVGKPVFCVLRIDFTEGVDPVYLYMNPQPGAAEPSAATASLINLNVNFVNRVSLTGPGGSAFDAIRIGTTFADVAPATSDFDGDGDVDGDDLALWRTGFGTAGAATAGDGDADADGNVDGRDFLIWQRQFGFDLTPGTITAVPEPGRGGPLILGLAIAGSALRRRAGARAYMDGRSGALC
ncbi:hypothetical protein [Lacipirellula limnantheis]|uniref:hypothetical protein n=1 Tax=Lacipirellula limnantheis TaxID=2528024 RepID=UPI0011A473D9|nr:hypothetical protein [Lacipirellula limnantheis]